MCPEKLVKQNKKQNKPSEKKKRKEITKCSRGKNEVMITLVYFHIT